MTSDIVRALQQIAEQAQCDCWICDTATQAAAAIQSLTRQTLDTAVTLHLEQQAARTLATAALRISEHADEHTATMLRHAIADWSRLRHQQPQAT